MTMIAITSCCKSNTLDVVDTDKAYLSLSKGRDLNGSPVYDLWVFKNGKVLFKGIDNVKRKGIYETMISTKTVKKIKKLSNFDSKENIKKTKGRDSPLTLLRYNGKKIAFQDSRISDKLLILNNLLEDIKNKFD